MSSCFIPYQCVIVESSETGTADFHKIQEIPKGTSSNRQPSSTNLPFENWDDLQKEAFGSGQKYLELSATQKDHDCCRISTKPPESGI